MKGTQPDRPTNREEMQTYKTPELKKSPWNKLNLQKNSTQVFCTSVYYNQEKHKASEEPPRFFFFGSHNKLNLPAQGVSSKPPRMEWWASTVTVLPPRSQNANPKKNETTQRKEPRLGEENRKKKCFYFKEGEKTNYVRGNQAFHVVQLPTLQPTAKRHSFMWRFGAHPPAGYTSS